MCRGGLHTRPYVGESPGFPLDAARLMAGHPRHSPGERELVFLRFLTVARDNLTVFDDHGQMLAALQHPDVSQRIGREYDEIGEFSRR